MPQHYDYIIAGAGCAASSLLLRMLKEPFFREKKMLVIDPSPQNTNDRTWCFWENKPGFFEEIVYHRWKNIRFLSNKFSAQIDIAPYEYKMIRSVDFYQYVRQATEEHTNITRIHESVTAVVSAKDHASVTVGSQTFTADYVFNSIPPKMEKGMLQHFKGWLIETEQPRFDPSTATFMDFTVGQQHGTAFMYVLPVSATQALVEYTLFTEELLAQEAYKTELKKYISETLQLNNYKLLHEEYGIIPMSANKFPRQDNRIIYIGTAGGQVKASSGYAFQFIQKRTDQIIRSLISNGKPDSGISFNERKAFLYDKVLLYVLQKRKMNGDEIFSRIFKQNPSDRIFRFLDNESSLKDDWHIMQSVPSKIFLPVALRELISF